MTETLDPRALNRALLARQHLLERVRTTVAGEIEHLVGLQAQVPMAPYTGLWARVEGFDPEALGAMLERREVVRMGLMRVTVHLVTARDALALHPLMQPMHDRVLEGSFAKRLAGLDRDVVRAEVLAALRERPLQPSEIGRHLESLFPGHDREILGIAGCQWLGLVQVPPRGVWGKSGRALHAPLADWLEPAEEPGPGMAEILLRYLAAFGPASVADMQIWSRHTRLAEVVEPLRERLLTFTDERGRELFDLPDAPRPDAATPAPVRFIPEYDNLLLSHADRSRVIADGDRERVFVRGAVLVDGFVAVAWRIRRTTRAATLELEPLRRLTRAERRAVEDEAAELMRFSAAGLTHAVRWP